MTDQKETGTEPRALAAAVLANDELTHQLAHFLCVVWDIDPEYVIWTAMEGEPHLREPYGTRRDLAKADLTSALRKYLASPPASPPAGTEEGTTCNRAGCAGVIRYQRDGACSCHISPPCSSCENSYLTCPVCGWDEHGEDAA